MYSPENGEYIRHSSVAIDHRDNQIKVSKNFTWYCIYWKVWTSNWETASSERCVLHAIPVTSWTSTESDAYDKWSRCTAIKRIGWTLAFLQCVHNWRETYSEKKSVLSTMFKNKCQTRIDRKTDKWKERMCTYNHQLKSRLFDISTLDRQRMRNLVDDIPRVWLPWGPERVTDQLLYLLLDRKWEKTTQRRQKDQLSYKRMKKNEECFRPVAIPWKDVPSDLQPGESTPTSSEDTKDALYEGWDTISDSDGDIPRSIKMHLWCYGGSLWRTPWIILPYTTIRQMSKAWILYYYWQTHQHESLLQTPSGFSCNNCCQRNV